VVNLNATTAGPSQAASSPGTGRKKRRGGGWAIALAILALLLVVLIAIWNWDWFIPFVDSRASAAIGHKVTIQHLHVRLGGTTRVTADGVRVENPEGFPAEPPLATIDHLSVGVRVLTYISRQIIDIPLIDLDHPVVNAVARPDGTENWLIKSKDSDSTKKSSSPPPKLGLLRIRDGHVHVVDPKFKTDMTLLAHTTHERDEDGGRVVVTAEGTYSHQPITGRFVGGAVLTLTDRVHPYPVDLHVANGQTRVALTGEVDQPLTFGGARLKLVFQGPDMALLLPLTGVAIPHTPPFKVTGNLDYQKRSIVFDNFQGTVGSSDLGGRIAVDAHGKVPKINADLASKKVDLNDLAGFIGATPGSSKTAGITAEQKQELAQSKASKEILPDKPFSIPQLRSANVHLTYKGTRIEGRYIPLDNIVAVIDIQDGRITVHPLDFAVGKGAISSNFDLNPAGSALRTKAHIDFRKVDLSRVMQATHAFKGQGLIGGQANLTTTGNSVASMLGNGSGGLTLVVSGNGDISALLQDIAGLEVGNAVMSALGMPNRADLRCLIADMPLKDGILSARTFLIQTSEARTTGRGDIDLRNQTLNYALTTRSTHFSVGSLPGAINVTGKLSSPSILPGAEVAARAGAATALGVLLVPLALLPTIQTGVGEGACTTALQAAKENPAAKPAAPPAASHAPALSARHHHR